ncbi:MAG: PAS domain-containing protein [Desulfosporosinus sp.]|nr:PAS domain-containing protein [Desulfosporosinus sp.]
MDEENAAQAAELVLANKELAYQKKLAYQNEVNGKLVKELIIANKELAFQNEEKEKRATELVVAKELALISVERLNEVQRLAHLGSWEMDIATGVSFWSDEFFRICGFEPNSFKPTAEIGMTIIHPDDRARTTAEIEKAINELCDYKIEKRIVRPDGSVRYVSSIGEIECDKDNKPISLQGFILDITDRKNNEVELRRIKERLQEAQEFAHLGYWELDIISKKYLWSDELFRIFGFNPQGFVPTLNDFLEIIHSKDKEIILKAIEEPLNICEFDLRIIRQDNETIWIHEKIRYEYDVSGKPVRIYGVVQDITQRKLSELKLKESEEKFKELAENLGEVIWVRQNEHLVYINPAYEKVWGRTCQSLYDNPHSFIDEIHPEDRERIVQAYLGESRTLQGLFEAQYRIIRPDGSIRWIWDRALPICDENGRMIRCVGIADDITKIKDLEEEALKNTMEKEMARLDKLSLVGAVAAGIGHEIRNPMTTVRGYLQLLGSKEEFAKYNAQFSLMIDELDRANSIITEFLSLAKDRVVELSMQSLKEIVENIFPLIQADGVLSDKYIQMELEEVPEIPLDKKEIHQLILNLVLNGSQAMSPAGIMKIKTYMDKDEIVLAVQDDGGGIAPEALGKIGTPFFTTKENGTGLGLAVCYSIVARHNAKIDIETGPTGTTFFVRFKK